MDDRWLVIIGSMATPLLTIALWWVSAVRKDSVRREDLMIQDLRSRLEECQERLRAAERDNERLMRRIALREGESQ